MSKIVVYASFPNEIHSKAVNLDPSNWTWFPCIQISAENDLHFSSRPYTWLHYAIGAIVGAHGHLAATNITLLQVSLSISWLCIIILTTRRSCECFQLTLTFSTSTSLPVWSPHDVLSAHAKGDKYIQVNTQRRARSAAEHIANVDDLRNGLLLHPFMHRGLGRNVAFLVVRILAISTRRTHFFIKAPNFAMETSDKGRSDLHCVAHAFIDDPYCLGDPHLRSGTSVRICDDLTQWPPQTLFDLVYASAVLVHFGTLRLRDQFSANGFKDRLYPQGVGNSTRAEYLARDERTKKRKNRDQLDAYDMITFLPYINMGAEKMFHTFKEAEERAEAAERTASTEKVEQWRDHLE